MNEFNLSERVISMDYENMRLVAYGDFVNIEDVKEFIKRLKEESDNRKLPKWVLWKIDKLAGSELLEKEDE